MTDELLQSDEAQLAGIDNPPDGAKIAYQGMPGAYSHLACHNLFPDHDTIPSQSFEDAFNHIETGLAHYAVIPIENSLGGRVSDVHHILPSSGLTIIGEYFLPINHCLWGIKGATIDDIKTVMSHEQALAQCRQNLHDLGVMAQATSDTAGAADELAKSQDKSKAVLSSKIAGEIYGLDLLRTRMEDRLDNVTRFIILSAGHVQPALDVKGDYITSLYYDVRSIPAALYKSLGGFATRGVNIIRIESYVSVVKPNRASFYLECEGHPKLREVDQSLEELQFYSTRLKILGVYHKNPYRQKLALHQD